MKVLCDVHISFKVVKFFQEQQVEALHINKILDGFYTSDTAICHFADANDLVVITKDVNFRNSYFLHKTSRKFIRIGLENIPNAELIKVLRQHLQLLKAQFKKRTFYLEIGPGSIIMMPGE